MMSMCEKCGIEIPADEVNKCDRCGADGLCNTCIGQFDHECDPDEDEDDEEMAAIWEDWPEVELAELFKLVMDHSEGMCPGMTFAIIPDVGNNDEGVLVADAWELVIFECLSELVGGQSDGAEVFSGWSTCLEPLLMAMGPPEGSPSKVPHIHWSCEVGIVGLHGIPHVSLTGMYKGAHVTVTLLSRPPEDEKPMWQINEQGHMIPIEDEADGD